MEKKVTFIISLIFLVVGLSFLVTSQANITGAVIGTSTTPSETGFFAGVFLILISFVLFAVSIERLEKKSNNHKFYKLDKSHQKIHD